MAYLAEDGIPYTEFRPHVTITTPSAKHPTMVALIDTGADDGFDLADITNYPLRAGLIKKDSYSVGIGGYWRPLSGQLAGDILLGPTTWRNPEISAAIDNRIGSEALAPLRILIDPTRRMLWVLSGESVTATKWNGPLDPDGRPAVYGLGIYPEGDASIVKEVDAGSRAERAGLRIGDRILLDNTTGNTAGSSPEKNLYQTRLQVVRGSERLEITMSLLDPPPVITRPAASVR